MSCVIHFDPSSFSGDGTEASPLTVALGADQNTTNQALSYATGSGLLTLTDSDGGSLSVTVSADGTTNQTLTYDPATGLLTLTDSLGAQVATTIPSGGGTGTGTSNVSLGYDETSHLLTLTDSAGDSVTATIPPEPRFLRHTWSTLGGTVDEGTIGPMEPLHIEYPGRLQFVEIDVRHTENVNPPSAVFDVDSHNGGTITIWAVRNGSVIDLGDATLLANQGHVVSQTLAVLQADDQLIPILTDTGAEPLVSPRFRIGYTQDI